jgi:hypothetical protein
MNAVGEQIEKKPAKGTHGPGPSGARLAERRDLGCGPAALAISCLILKIW